RAKRSSRRARPPAPPRRRRRAPVRPTPAPLAGPWPLSRRGFDEPALSVEPAAASALLRARSAECLEAGRADRVRCAQARVDRVQRSGRREEPGFLDSNTAAPGAAGNQLAAIEQCPDFREEAGAVLGFPGGRHRPYSPAWVCARPLACGGRRRRWLCTTASARSASFLPVCCDWSRSILNASSSSIELRAIKIPFACSILARRPKAPCRLWYSANRCRVMSIALASSSGSSWRM